MPEASIDKYYCTVFREDQIRSARERSVMQPVAQSSSMKTAPYNHLRCRIAPADTAHIEPTLIWSQNVGHMLTLSSSFSLRAPLTRGAGGRATPGNFLDFFNCCVIGIARLRS